ncbi:hypothetical protein FN846DRAFT_889987 [Sphaerosporella brunnea]|uniref:P-loop containing nucleoside triphosphate hydrolase protein n=1 Tax=Sphaerosporella brunnea TaxID=1250544 RepID=A0A5J5EYV1_9PEZI|nr:hypothetical protein FN846DRAFT_889987 [Sphaerosporella brunnea]
MTSNANRNSNCVLESPSGGAEVGEQADVVQQAGDDGEQTPDKHELDGNVDAVEQPTPVENGLEGNCDVCRAVGRMPDENGLEDVDAVQQATSDENQLEGNGDVGCMPDENGLEDVDAVQQATSDEKELECNGDFGRMPDENRLKDVDAVQQAAPERNADVVYQAAAPSRLRPRGYGSLPAIGTDGSLRFEAQERVMLVEPTAEHLDKLLERRCQERAEKERQQLDKQAAEADTVCIVSEFAARLARLLEHRDQARPLVLFLRGQSGSGKTWLGRKLLESLKGAQVSITSFEGAAAPRILPKDKARREMLTPRLLDFVARWSKTAKTAANESSSRAVVAYSMNGLLLINMPDGEQMAERPAETQMINTTNMEVLATLDALHCGKFCRSFERNHAVKFVVDALRKPEVRVLVATVVCNTDGSNRKAFAALAGRFLRQPDNGT